MVNVWTLRLVPEIARNFERGQHGRVSHSIPRFGSAILAAGLLVSAALSTATTRAADESAFQSLFNGRDLSGWVNINCAPGTFSVTNGMIHCTGFPTGILRTERMYQNFILEVDWRHLKPKGNSGIYVWADPIPAVGQPFVRAVEVQVLDGLEGDWFTSDGDVFPIHGATMVPENGRKGGDRAFPTEKRMKPSPEWNHYRVECVDGEISLAVNGKVVTRGHRSSPRKGYIGLESEGSPAEFRNLRVQELPSTPTLEPRQIAVPPEGLQPVYTGVDLAGWTVSGTAEAWEVRDWILACPGKGGASSLTSTVSYGDAEHWIDFRWTGKAVGDWRRCIALRGLDLASMLDPEAATVALKPGQWSRLRVQIRGNQISVTLNGVSLAKDRPVTGIPATGAWVLKSPADGLSIDFANLLVKRLD